VYEEKDYLTLHKESGLKVGDKVKVMNRAKHHENGWKNAWSEGMNEAIGKTFTILRDCKHTGFTLDYRDEKYAFPYFCLKKVERLPSKKNREIIEYLRYNEIYIELDNNSQFQIVKHILEECGIVNNSCNEISEKCFLKLDSYNNTFYVKLLISDSQKTIKIREFVQRIQSEQREKLAWGLDLSNRKKFTGMKDFLKNNVKGINGKGYNIPIINEANTKGAITIKDLDWVPGEYCKLNNINNKEKKMKEVVKKVFKDDKTEDAVVVDERFPMGFVNDSFMEELFLKQNKKEILEEAKRREEEHKNRMKQIENN